MSQTFTSEVRAIDAVEFPDFDPDTRVIMMPFLFGVRASLPAMLDEWGDLITSLTAPYTEECGKVGYVSIDQKLLRPGETLRRPGKHMDGSPIVADAHPGSPRPGPPWAPGTMPEITAWAPSGPPTWASHRGGMIMASSTYGCDTWVGEFTGVPGIDGECDHLAEQCTEEKRVPLSAKVAYWANGTCVHESLPMLVQTERQWIRISFPSDGAWYDGYTPNPVGILPAGVVLPRRKYMSEVS